MTKIHCLFVKNGLSSFKCFIFRALVSLNLVICLGLKFKYTFSYWRSWFNDLNIKGLSTSCDKYVCQQTLFSYINVKQFSNIKTTALTNRYTSFILSLKSFWTSEPHLSLIERKMRKIIWNYKRHWLYRRIR